VNSQGLFSIGGIASGLDTANIITQLMQLERQPVVKMQSTQADLRKVDEAWQQVNTRLSALRTAVDAIRRPDRFNGMIAVTSSNPDAVGVTRTGTNATGSLSFGVKQLATAHQVSLAYGAADEVLTGEAMSVTVGDNTVNVEVQGKTLAAVAKELNDAKGGFTASVVKVGENEHALILTAAKTGTANAIAVDGNAPTAVQRQAAQDAIVTIGSGAEALEVTRSSNTITDLVPGATITLKQTTDAPVTVTASQDVDAGVAAVKSYVDALNAAMKTIRDLSAYNAETKKGGPLQGDADARRLLDTLRQAALSTNGEIDGPFQHAFQVGLSFDRTGVLQMDDTKLRAAFNTDFQGVARLFSTMNAETTTVSGGSVSAPSGMEAGTYEIAVSSLATATTASTTFVAQGSPTAERNFQIVVDGEEITVKFTRNGGAQGVRDAMQAALAGAGITSLEVGGAGDEITLTETRVGSAHTFSIVTNATSEDALPGFDVVTAGTDATGTIDGFAATGSGNVLTATQGATAGMTFTAPATGDFTATHTQAQSKGLGLSIHSALQRAEGINGLVSRARRGITNQIQIYQTRIDGFDQRLATREATLRRQFTAMETMLGTMNSQMSWLNSQIAGLNSLRPPQ
jgi:flagellar hook-associated protein 2